MMTTYEIYIAIYAHIIRFYIAYEVNISIYAHAMRFYIVYELYISIYDHTIRFYISIYSHVINLIRLSRKYKYDP